VDVDRSVNKITVDKLDNEGLICSMGSIFLVNHSIHTGYNIRTPSSPIGTSLLVAYKP